MRIVYWFHLPLCLFWEGFSLLGVISCIALWLSLGRSGPGRLQIRVPFMLVSSLLCFPFNFFVPMLVIWGAMFCTSLLVPIRFSAWHCLCNLCLFVHTCALLVIFQAFLFFCRHRWCQLVHFVFFCLPFTFSVPIFFHGRDQMCQLVHHCAFLVLFGANTFLCQTGFVWTCSSSLCFSCTFSVQVLFHGQNNLCRFVLFCALLVLFRSGYHLCFLPCSFPVPINTGHQSCRFDQCAFFVVFLGANTIS